MNEENSNSRPKSPVFIQPPAYPFTPRQLFGDLRARLEMEHERPMSFGLLGKMIGLSKSKAYHWFELFQGANLAGGVGGLISAAKNAELAADATQSTGSTGLSSAEQALFLAQTAYHAAQGGTSQQLDEATAI